MTNKLLIPLTVAASLTIGAASYHFGAPFVEDYLASQEQTTKLQKSTDAQPNALVQATIAPVTSVPQPTVTYQHKENPPADIVQLVNRMEAMTDAYFSKEQQVDRIYNKARLHTGQLYQCHQKLLLEKNILVLWPNLSILVKKLLSV